MLSEEMVQQALELLGSEEGRRLLKQAAAEGVLGPDATGAAWGDAGPDAGGFDYDADVLSDDAAAAAAEEEEEEWAGGGEEALLGRGSPDDGSIYDDHDDDAEPVAAGGAQLLRASRLHSAGMACKQGTAAAHLPGIDFSSWQHCCW